MKTDYNSYPIETKKIVDEILSIDLAERMRIMMFVENERKS